MKPALSLRSAPNPFGIAAHICTFRTLISFILLVILNVQLQAQDNPSDSTPQTNIAELLRSRVGCGIVSSVPSPNKKRIWLISAANAAAYSGSFVLLHEAWYKNAARSSFHTFNDAGEWMQMDKAGHSWSTYNLSRASASIWQWAGLSHKKAVWLGGLTGGTVYLTAIEFMDAYSAKWGWSWADIGANLFGSGLFISQELGWKEQRLQLKFSFHHHSYNDPQIETRANDLFGKSAGERMLKDYNAQTYWLSGNVRSFFPKSNWPAWLNIAVGYGADGMFGGFENKWTTGDPPVSVDRSDIDRTRQFYLSPDIDFTKIKTNSRLVKTLLFGLNAFKCPAPALMLNSKGKMRLHAVYF